MDAPSLVIEPGASLVLSTVGALCLSTAGLLAFVIQDYATEFDLQPGGNRLTDEQGATLTDENGDTLTW